MMNAHGRASSDDMSSSTKQVIIGLSTVCSDCLRFRLSPDEIIISVIAWPTWLYDTAVLSVIFFRI